MMWDKDEYKDLKFMFFDALMHDLKIEHAEKITMSTLRKEIDGLFDRLIPKDDGDLKRKL